MNTWVFRWCVLIAVSCAGCGTFCATKTVYDKPAFYEQQIRSMTWTDTQGNVIRLLDWSVVDLKHLGKVVVARFGPSDKGIATCLDFYRVVPKFTPTGVDSYVLTEHDCKYGMVISVEPIWQGRSVFFQITKETIPGTEKQRKRFTYTLDYTKDYRMQPGLEVFEFNIPDLP